MDAAIHIAGLSKSFGNLRAVDSLSFSVGSGEVFVLSVFNKFV